MKRILKRIFRAKKGVTILEGLIALGLLALVASGTFGVLLSISRQSSSPDIREEMVWAVERAHERLQIYAAKIDATGHTNLNPRDEDKLCDVTDPFSSGKHDISCMLPAICDPAQSEFSYTIQNPSETFGVGQVSYYAYANSNSTDDAYEMSGMIMGSRRNESAPIRKINFDITCNGFTL